MQFHAHGLGRYGPETAACHGRKTLLFETLEFGGSLVSWSDSGFDGSIFNESK